MENTIRPSIFIALLALIYLLAWLLQDQFFLNGDLSYSLHATKLFLAGGSYAKDFFDPNPPLIFYLLTPVLVFSKAAHLNIILASRMYIFLWITGSLILSFYLIQTIVKKEKPFHAYAFIMVLALIFLCAPLYHFGERDHLLVILAMPYILLLASRLQNKQQVLPLPLEILIGFLAGLGFCLKPQFLLPWVLLELFYMYAARDYRVWQKMETLIIVGVFISYTISTYLFYPEYIYIVAPYFAHTFYQNVSDSWHAIFLAQAMLFCYAVLLFCCAQIKKNPYPILNSTLLAALVGFLLAYFLQFTPFYYHALPALSLAILLLALFFITQLYLRKNTIFILLASLLLLYLFPLFAAVSWKGIEYKHAVLAKLVDFMHTQPSQLSVYVFARWGSYSFPVSDYTDSKVVQRFACLWPILDFVAQGLITAEEDMHSQTSKDKEFFINMIAEDLQRHKPNLIFVDAKDPSLMALNSDFDYIAFFSENPRFREQWKAYHYLKTLDEYPLYKLVVYQRISA